MKIEFKVFKNDYTLERLTEDNAAPLFERFDFLTPCPVWHLSNDSGFEFSILEISSPYDKKEQEIPKRKRKYQIRSFSNYCSYSCSGVVSTYRPFGHTENVSFEESIAIEQAIKILNDMDYKSYTCNKINSSAEKIKHSSC